MRVLVRTAFTTSHHCFWRFCVFGFTSHGDVVGGMGWGGQHGTAQDNTGQQGRLRWVGPSGFFAPSLFIRFLLLGLL
jgi:hypothetical protein